MFLFEWPQFENTSFIRAFRIAAFCDISKKSQKAEEKVGVLIKNQRSSEKAVLFFISVVSESLLKALTLSTLDKISLLKNEQCAFCFYNLSIKAN